MHYGYIDIPNRILVFDGTPDPSVSYYTQAPRNEAFTLNDYLGILMQSQGASFVDSAEEADLTLVMGKPAAENEVSLIDSNFFLEG